MNIEKAFSFDSLDDALRSNQLGQASFDRFAPSGRAISMSNWLHSTGGADPVLLNQTSSGTPINSCRYVRINNFVQMHWRMLSGPSSTFGTAGVWYIDLPVKMDPTGQTGTRGDCCGTWNSVGGPSGQWGSGSCWAEQGGVGVSDRLYMVYITHTTPGIPLGAEVYVNRLNPWTWTGDSSYLYGSFSYFISDVYTTSVL